MAAPEPITLRKAIIAVLMVAWLMLMLWLLQRSFDFRDFDNVDALIDPPGAAWSLKKELQARHPGDEPRCDQKQLVSSFRGLVRVLCASPTVDAYRFEADLVRKKLRGLDPRSEDVMAAVEMKRQAPDSGAR